MDKKTAVVIGVVCMGIGFAIRFLAEATTWNKDMTTEQLKNRIKIGYGALIAGIVIGVLIIQCAASS